MPFLLTFRTAPHIYLQQLVRESPDARRMRLEETALQDAIRESIAIDESQRKAREFSTLSELKEKLHFLDKTYRSVVQHEEKLLFCRITHSPHPKIIQSVNMKANCTFHAYINDIEVHRLGNYSIPAAINDINERNLLLTNLRRTDGEEY